MKSLVIALLFSLVSYQAFAKSSDELFDSGQYDKAFRAAYADALNGNSLDAFIIGRILLEGLGSAEKDQQLAVRFLEESADARNMGAAEYLGRAYYEAELLPKSNNLAYEYLSRAKGLGIDGLDDLLIEIASNLDGVISEQTCKLYFEDKKNPDFAFNLGQCIENAFLEGSANDFYLRAFDDGTVNALIPAMRIALKQEDEQLFRIFEQLETFLVDARKSEIKEITDLVNANRLKLFDLAKKERNGNLSHQIAEYYDDGTFFGKADKKQALNYYQLAKSQGKTGLNSKIQTLTVAVEGATSKGACLGYSKKDKTVAKRLAVCAKKGHITGDPGEYFLLAFANGDTGSFLEAANTLIDRTDEAFAPEKILNAIPDFREKASAEQISEFGELIERKGHSALDCEQKFDKLNTKVSGDIYSCLLSAEAATVTGDYSSITQAIEIWKNGYGDVFPNETHAKNLQNIVKEDINADGVIILTMLEKEPMEHFKRTVEFYDEGRITRSEATSALKLEFQLFAEGRWSEFTGDRAAERQIELLITTADLSQLEPEILAQFLAHLVKNETKLSNAENIKKQLAAIKFSLDWATILKDIAFDVAGTFVSPVVTENCGALQLAIDNDGLVPETKLTEAKAKLLSQCDIFNISANDLQQMININPDDGFKRLGIVLTSDKRPACKLISLYLQNENAIVQSRERFSYNPKDQIRRCLNQDPAISYLFSVNLLDKGDYPEAFDISSLGCERKSYSSCAVSGFILQNKLLDKSVENSIANKAANKYLKVGFENFDGNSTMLYLSVNRPSVTKLNIFSMFKMDPEEAESIENRLRNKNFTGMPVVEAESCVSTNLIGNCRSVCRAAETHINKFTTDRLQKMHGEKILRLPKCKD